MTLFKAVLHNIGVTLVGIAFAYVGTLIDFFFSFTGFISPIALFTGALLLLAGFLLRVWATYYFYCAHMRVIVLEAQQHLITGGPFRFSRNPLYLGGNVLIFFGAGLFLGSPTMIIFTALHLIGVDLFIRREERQLEARFGDEWRSYSARVRRWI